MPADPNIGEGGGQRGNPHEKCKEGRRKRGHDVSKSPTVLAEHKGDGVILESSPTGNNYFTDQPRLKTDR